MRKDDIITELVELILLQERELDSLKRKIKRIEEYIEVYEEYIRGED